MPKYETDSPNHAVIGLIVNPDRSKTLLLKRNQQKPFFPGEWAPVAAGPYPSTQDFRQIMAVELEVETGIKGAITLEAPPTSLSLGNQLFTLHPFLIEMKENQPIVLNDEHTEFKWVPIFQLISPEYNSRLLSGIGSLLHLEQLRLQNKSA